MKKACKGNLPALIFLFSLLMLWQLGAMKVNAAYILPTPIQILKKLWELRSVLFTVHLPATMLVTLVGLLISLALGLGLAVLMDASPFFRKAVYPIVVRTYTDVPATGLKLEKTAAYAPLPGKRYTLTHEIGYLMCCQLLYDVMNAKAA